MLAFLRSRHPGEPRQVWVMHTHGGEARQLTDAPKGVQDFAWSPDGARIVFCADTEPAAGAAAGSQGGGPRVVEVNCIRFRQDLQGWRGDAHYHLFVAELESGEMTQITRGDWDDYGPVWSPDGTKSLSSPGAAMTGTFAPSPRLRGQRRRRRGRVLVGWAVQRRRGGLVARLAAAGRGRLRGPGGDGAVAGAGSTSQGRAASTAASRRRTATGTGRRPRRGPAAGDSLDRRRSHHLSGGAPRRELHLPGHGRGRRSLPALGRRPLGFGLSLDGDARRAAVASSSPCSPSEIHLAHLADSAAEPVADPNADFLSRQPAIALEKFSLQRGGFDIEGRLWFPPFFDPAGSYPLVLDIHGGPNGAFYDSYVPWQQLLAGSGYLVLAVNPGGHPPTAMSLCGLCWTTGAARTISTSWPPLDHVCQREYVDEERLGIHGYSYGGYMSGWAIGHTKRFGAAVIGAPCTNLYTMYGTSDIGISFGEPQWGGSVMDTPEKLLSRSPISYAKHVTTPTLLLHGEADLRCPIAQSEEYFTALKRQGKTVEFVRFPNSNHSFPRTGHPRMREEYLSRMLDWFDGWLA